MDGRGRFEEKMIHGLFIYICCTIIFVVVLVSFVVSFVSKFVRVVQSFLCSLMVLSRHPCRLDRDAVR